MNRLMTLPLALAICAFNALAWDFQDISHTLDNYPTNASCVAWGDVDSDGNQDLFVGGHNGSESALYLSERGSFTNVTESSSLTGITDVRGAEFIDFDQDGALDLVCTTESGVPVQLFRQTDTRRFQPVNLNLSGHEAVRSIAWIDQDQDGQLDLILSNGEGEGTAMTVLRQQSFEFNQVRDNELPDPGIEIGTVTWVDWDHDGDLDLFLGAYYSSQRAHIYVNQDGQLLDCTDRISLPKHMGATGICWFDFNGDNKLDLFSPGAREDTELLYYYPENDWHHYKPVADQLNVSELAYDGVYACPIDANMDGSRELFVVRKQELGCALLMNPGFDQQWIEIGEPMGIANRHARNNGAAWGDCDGDGDADLAIAQEEFGVRVYRNNVSPDHEFVVLHLCGANDNTPLPNCDVRFDFQHDKDFGSTARTVSMNSGNGSSITLVNESNYKSSELNCEVTWPNGEITTYNYDQIVLNKHNWLHQPTAFPEIQQISPVADGGDPRIIGNAPNPFNPSTRITFSLPAAGHVQLTVFDLTGRNVATLADAMFAAGEHTLNFNAGLLSSGTYMVRLTSPETSVVHRMMLLK